MNWLVLVVLYALVGNVLGPILIKTAATGLGRVERFALQYFFAAALMLAVLFATGFTLSRSLLFAVCIGFANGFGTYCQWRAVDLSLSKTALFSWGSGLIAVVLGYVLLNERTVVTPVMASGLLLVFLSVVLLAIREHRAHKKNAVETGGASVYLWITGYSLIWGVVEFLTRVFAVNGVGTATFLGGWYFGSFLVGLVLLVGVWGRSGRVPLSFSVRGTLLSAALALMIVANLGLGYWVYHYLPLAVAQPLFLILGAVAPALVGLFYFKEGKRFDRQEWLLYGLGAVGAILVVIGFVSV